MIRTLTIDEALSLVKSTPEQAVFDWKSDFVVLNDEDKCGEFLKDVAAIANACSSSYGFVVYGVDPRRPDPVLGISQSYDDAKLSCRLRRTVSRPRGQPRASCSCACRPRCTVER